jgi:patatin-like phospholipase/acyl hydrolase
MNQHVTRCINSEGSKKILACDGGGILGLISVEILLKLESQLRTKNNNPDLVLADYFDFVCGTSTGAIIATCISAGMSMQQIKAFYISSGEQMFEKAFILNRLRYAYDDEPLAKKLRVEINRALGHDDDDAAATLGDPNLRTLLMLVMRNHTTDSPWPISNNPFAKYNQLERKDCNLKLPLWQLVRASTAAPTFFPPEVVTFSQGTPSEYSFIFVDGGVTTYNNPAFLAFQMATAAPYEVNWKTGVDDLLIVSIGTGNAANARPDLSSSDLWLMDHAKNIPSALMNAATAGWDMACRMLGDCRFGREIDREVGDMVNNKETWTGDKLFTYVRYDPDVSPMGLSGLDLDDINPRNVQVMDSVKHIKDIQTVGATYANKYLDLEHLGSFT